MIGLLNAGSTMASNCLLCRWIAKPWLLVLLGLIVLALLLLAYRWAWLIAWLYVAFLILAGLLALALIARGIFKKLCWKWMADPKGAGSQGHPPVKAVKVPPTIYKRPDPLIYSQDWMSARGLAVTWDNPDIKVWTDGPTPAPAEMHALMPDADHLLRARVWNGSTEAPAADLLVRFWYFDFGIGTVRKYIGQTLIDLPVKGSAALPATAELPWRTPAAEGHYCVQVELVWPDDADPGNNLGQTNLDVKKLNSPNANFAFTLRNDTLEIAAFKLTADSYRLLAPRACSTLRGQRRRASLLEPHLRANNALPEGWTVAIDQGIESAPLRPGEERSVKVEVVAPDGFEGELDINVNAFAGRLLIGGVTLRVHS